MEAGSETTIVRYYVALPCSVSRLLNVPFIQFPVKKGDFFAAIILLWIRTYPDSSQPPGIDAGPHEPVIVHRYNITEF